MFDMYWFFINIIIAASYFVIPMCIAQVYRRIINPHIWFTLGTFGFMVFIWSCGVGHVTMTTMSHAAAPQLITHSFTALVSAATASFVLYSYKRLVEYLIEKGIAE